MGSQGRLNNPKLLVKLVGFDASGTPKTQRNRDISSGFGYGLKTAIFVRKKLEAAIFRWLEF